MPVTVLGGGSRVIEVLPWDRAQIGFTDYTDAERAEGQSKLDRTVVFEFLVGLYDRDGDRKIDPGDRTQHVITPIQEATPHPTLGAPLQGKLSRVN